MWKGMQFDPQIHNALQNKVQTNELPHIFGSSAVLWEHKCNSLFECIHEVTIYSINMNFWVYILSSAQCSSIHERPNRCGGKSLFESSLWKYESLFFFLAKANIWIMNAFAVVCGGKVYGNSDNSHIQIVATVTALLCYRYRLVCL